MTEQIATNSFHIDQSCISFMCSRSSGPGGQNVNKLNTKVTLVFDLASCEGLSDKQKQIIRKKLGKRFDSSGCLKLDCQTHRSQKANKDEALERLVQMIAVALRPRRRRKKTKVPYGVKQKRLKAKKHRGMIKKLRSNDDLR